MSRGRASGRSTHVPAPGHIVLASDVVALSRPNGSIHLAANRPCGNRADGGDGARGMLSLGAVAGPFYRLAIVTIVSVRGVVGTFIAACPARGGDRAVAVGR